MAGLPVQIAQYIIAEEKVKGSLVLKVSNNIHNVAVLDQAELISETSDKKKVSTKLKYKLSSYALAPAVRRSFVELEQKL